MKTLLNIIWLVLAGLWLAISYVIAGVAMFITIIGIPFGIQAFKLAGYALWPFGRTLASTPALALKTTDLRNEQVTLLRRRGPPHPSKPKGELHQRRLRHEHANLLQLHQDGRKVVVD